MNPFAGANREMMAAFRADLQVFIQFLVENHAFAFRTFGPKPFGDVLLALSSAQFGLLKKGCLRVGWRRSYSRLHVKTQSFLGERGRCHNQLRISVTNRGLPSIHKLPRPLPPGGPP